MEQTLEVFAEAIRTMETAGVEYGVFGGVAVWGYGQRRATKDIDFLICPQDADAALDALSQAGFSTERTDPAWLYKADKDGVSVDVIFEVAGGEVPCERVLERRRRVTIEGIDMNVIAPEDVILIKLAVIRAERCWDWFDSVGVLKSSGGELDWDYLIERSRVNPHRLLSLLLYAKTAGCENEVPDGILRRLAGLVGIGGGNRDLQSEGRR